MLTAEGFKISARNRALVSDLTVSRTNDTETQCSIPEDQKKTLSVHLPESSSYFYKLEVIQAKQCCTCFSARWTLPGLSYVFMFFRGPRAAGAKYFSTWILRQCSNWVGHKQSGGCDRPEPIPQLCQKLTCLWDERTNQSSSCSWSSSCHK